MSPLNFVFGLCAVSVAAAALAFAGCSEHIALGSECRELESPCPAPSLRDDASAPVAHDAGGALDAARPSDGGVVRPPIDTSMPVQMPDTAVEPEEPRYPAFSNPSFDLKQGGPGDITTVNAVLPGGTLIAPWYTCQPIGGGNTGLTAVRAETTVERLSPDGGVVEVVQPSDGATMVSIAHLANAFFPLMQELGEPLQGGRRYAFTIDVRALASMPEVWLQVWGADGCVPAEELLAESKPAMVGSWKTVCFDFSPERSHRLVLLQARSSLALGERLLFDNIRPVPGCADYAESVRDH